MAVLYAVDEYNVKSLIDQAKPKDVPESVAPNTEVNPEKEVKQEEMKEQEVKEEGTKEETKEEQTVVAFGSPIASPNVNLKQETVEQENTVEANDAGESPKTEKNDDKVDSSPGNVDGGDSKENLVPNSCSKLLLEDRTMDLLEDNSMDDLLKTSPFTELNFNTTPS